MALNRIRNIWRGEATGTPTYIIEAFNGFNPRDRCSTQPELRVLEYHGGLPSVRQPDRNPPRRPHPHAPDLLLTVPAIHRQVHASSIAIAGAGALLPHHHCHRGIRLGLASGPGPAPAHTDRDGLVRPRHPPLVSEPSELAQAAVTTGACGIGFWEGYSGPGEGGLETTE
jgi:hypothetical protein